jgi:hypothetical protein
MNPGTVYSQADPLNNLNDALWSATQRSRVLQDLRRDIRIVWADEAAREINDRHLSPHETDDFSMRERIKEQAELLKQAGQKVDVSQDFGQQAEDLSNIIAERIKFARQDLENAYSNYDVFVQYNSDARSKLPTIQQLINRANSACQ